MGDSFLVSIVVGLHALIDRLQRPCDGKLILELNSDPLVSQCFEH